jgi:hypothetical protein
MITKDVRQLQIFQSEVKRLQLTVGSYAVIFIKQVLVSNKVNSTNSSHAK